MIQDSAIPKTKPIYTQIDVESEHIKNHNKDCEKARTRLAKNTDDFGRGHLLATFCICNGQEDIVATNYNVSIKRTYQSGNLEMYTQQGFTLYNPTSEELELIHKNVMKNVKLKGNVGREIITEVKRVSL